ncbi:hypothetical protein R1flu_018132 [Riccia fluitans]|uniref:Secreted protein n=1 Tax=Riccia fluitans TaxID=41844 RepID=A0ABD1ZID8_9MARC
MLAARTVPVPPFSLSRSILPCWSSARLSTRLMFIWFYVLSSHVSSSAVTPPFAVPCFHVVACLWNVSRSATPFPRASGSSSDCQLGAASVSYGVRPQPPPSQWPWRRKTKPY